jgi:hypothetical protein
MACIHLPALSRKAAEAALVTLWCRLEEHGLPTPKLDVAFGENDTVTISLPFADPAHANIALHGWDPTLGRKSAAD